MNNRLVIITKIEGTFWNFKSSADDLFISYLRQLNRSRHVYLAQKETQQIKIALISCNLVKTV